MSDAFMDEGVERILHLDSTRTGCIALRLKSEQLADAQLVGVYPNEDAACAAARRILDSADHLAAVKKERLKANTRVASYKSWSCVAS
jgi:hypothetical protein